MTTFEYVDEQGNDITYDASDREVENVAKEIGYENIVDALIMRHKVDKDKLDEYTIRSVIDCLIGEGWIEPTCLADEGQIKWALYDRAVERERAYRAQQESDNNSWLERCRV